MRRRAFSSLGARREIAELGAESGEKLWRRGGFPLSFLARTEQDSANWRQEFIQTLLERDLPQ